MMSAPSAASARAMPRPIPLVDPVTSATLPCKLITTPDTHYNMDHWRIMSVWQGMVL